MNGLRSDSMKKLVIVKLFLFLFYLILSPQYFFFARSRRTILIKIGQGSPVDCKPLPHPYHPELGIES